MRKSLILAGFCVLFCGGSADAQDAGLRFHTDALTRQEWTKDIFLSPTQTQDENRRRFQIRPRLELTGKHFIFAVGGEANYSSDRNTTPSPALLRDNYESRDVRLDLALLSVAPSESFLIQGGRFIMPVPFTEMIWDQDLRPQGGAITLRALDEGGNTRFGVTLLGARGSHVFEDSKTEMLVASAMFGRQLGPQTRFDLTGSYIRYNRLDDLAPFIRRQNTRTAAGGFVNAYRILDLVGRLEVGGAVPLRLTADYCWNTEADDGNKGVWLAASLGSLRSGVLRADYTFARVNRDATLGAYATDDFFWSTGWQGHRLDLGTPAGPRASLHAIGLLQRFKESPRLEERDHWVKRFRVEIRYGN